MMYTQVRSVIQTIQWLVYYFRQGSAKTSVGSLLYCRVMLHICTTNHSAYIYIYIYTHTFLFCDALATWFPVVVLINSVGLLELPDTLHEQKAGNLVTTLSEMLSEWGLRENEGFKNIVSRRQLRWSQAISTLMAHGRQCDLHPFC